MAWLGIGQPEEEKKAEFNSGKRSKVPNFPQVRVKDTFQLTNVLFQILQSSGRPSEALGQWANK